MKERRYKVSFFKNLLKPSIFYCVIFLLHLLQLEAAEPLLNLSRISSVVKKRLIAEGADKFTNANQFTLSCKNAFCTDGKHFNHMVFEVDQNVETLWNLYTTSNPKIAWNGKSIKFDFAYSKRANAAYFKDDELPELHEGMGFFLVLNLYGLKKIPMGLEISLIDSKEKTFEYTYLKLNVSHGKQIVRFFDLGNNRTRIVHDTYFKSGNRFRDKLYPPIHEKLLREFHANILKQINPDAIQTESNNK